MQRLQRFEIREVDQRHRPHRRNQCIDIFFVRKGFVERVGRRKEERAGEKCRARLCSPYAESMVLLYAHAGALSIWKCGEIHYLSCAM